MLVWLVEGGACACLMSRVSVKCDLRHNYSSAKNKLQEENWKRSRKPSEQLKPEVLIHCTKKGHNTFFFPVVWSLNGTKSLLHLQLFIKPFKFRHRWWRLWWCSGSRGRRRRAGVGSSVSWRKTNAFFFIFYFWVLIVVTGIVVAKHPPVALRFYGKALWE